MHPSMHFVVLVAYASIFGLATSNKIIEVSLDTNHKYGDLSLENLEKHVSRIQSHKGEVSLRNFDNIYYVGSLAVGTPSQELKVIFDTGFSDTFVIDKRACTSEWKEFCSNHSTYDAKKSSTYKKTGKRFSAIHHRIEGEKAVDTMTLGNLTVENQAFGAITKIIGNIFGTMKFDGIVGLGYRSASELHAESLFMNMVKQKVVKSAVYSLHMTNCTCINSTMNTLMLGGIDSKHYTGDIIFTDVVDKKHFAIIAGLKMGAKSVVTSIKARLCSGCSMNYGPKNITDYINKAIGAEEHGCVWTVDCNKISSLPNIEIVIGSTSLVFKPQDYILKLTDGVCRSVFVEYSEPDLIFGVSLMRPYLTIFDMELNRVGFAKATN